MASDCLKFYLLTDLHYWSPRLGTSGKAYDKLYFSEHRCMAETGAIIDSAFNSLIADKDIDIVLIDGDLSAEGARESHEDLVPKLQRLKDAGKQVYLITATHDYFKNPPKAVGDKVETATETKREELYDIYHDFGWDRAISEHRESHSYSVMLKDGYRLLCLNDDSDGKEFCGYSDSQKAWIKSQANEAKEKGEYIFAITHHPALPPSPIYPLFSHRDMLGDYEKVTTMFADLGIKYVFTGHTHMQNIAVKKTESGNEIYDVNTGSLVTFPCPYRMVEITDTEVKINTKQVENFDWDFGGKTAQQYVKDHFNFFLNDIFNSAAYDIDRMAELSTAFSMTPEKIYKLKVPIKFIGKKMQTMTIGKLGKVLHIGKKIDPSVKDILLKDLFIELIDNIYYGDEPYTPDTPMYKSFGAILDKIASIVKISKKSDGIVKILNILKDGCLYDAPPADWNVILPR